MRKWICLCAVFGLLGCAESRQYFRPTEHVYGETMRGEQEAIYNMAGPFGPFGEAKVWSRGAFREHGDTVLYATIDLHNTSGVPIIIDPQRIKLDPVRAGKELFKDVAPVEHQTLSVAPGSFGSVRLRFVLPARVVPGQVSSFGLHWEVSNGPQKYAQRTPFLEERGGYAYASYPPPPYGWGYGYYGCSFADPWCRPYGFGAGIGWGARPAYVAPPAPSRPAREDIRVR